VRQTNQSPIPHTEIEGFPLSRHSKSSNGYDSALNFVFQIGSDITVHLLYYSGGISDGRLRIVAFFASG
jgi:hypothetical protein